MTRRRTALQRARQMGLQAAADPKAKRPPTPKMPPAGARPPAADKMPITKGATAPTPKKTTTPKVSPPPKVTARPKVTGKGGRDVVGKGPMGDRRLANVTAEQLKAAGLTGGPKGLRTYLNKFDELGRRPKPSDFKKKTPD